MKKLLAIMLILMFVVSAAACGIISGDDSGKKHTEKDKSRSDSTVSYATSSVEMPANPEYKTEVVYTEKTNYDNIRYFKSSLDSDMYVVEKDGNSGMIDPEGNVVLPIEYKSIYLFPYDTHNKEPWLMAMDDKFSTYRIGPDCTVTPQDEPYGQNGLVWVAYWYDNKAILAETGGDRKLLDSYYDYTFKKYYALPYMEEMLDSVSTGPEDFIFIKKADSITETSVKGLFGYEPAYEVTLSSERYGLFDLKRNVMITGFIFDDYSPIGFVEGVCPVKMLDKWYYIDTTGSQINGYFYEASYTDGKTEKIFSPLNGYIIVKKDGKFGLIDLDGNKVLDTAYDKISQVDTNGRVWVHNGNSWEFLNIIKPEELK